MALIVLVVVLVVLNAASYTQKADTPEDEFSPNRSSYNSGATGTRALYELLAESGARVTRWEQKTSALLGDAKNKPHTFVVVGDVRRPYADEEVEQLLRWVARGGKLVIIDRTPYQTLISTTADWTITARYPGGSAFGVDPFDQTQMTGGISAGKPQQPTQYTRGVIAVQPSRFASAIDLKNFDAGEKKNSSGILKGSGAPSPEEYYEEEEDAPPPPIAKPSPSSTDPSTKPAERTEIIQEQNTMPASSAPVVHIASGYKNLLADFPYGSGKIVFLSDPYIVSNAGIGLVDNGQLAINILSSSDGTIAFDEYHQGFGGNENQLLEYFAETPVPAIAAQLILLIAVVLFTGSRRFGRAFPPNEPSRLSKLEYVSAMAQLQGRTKAYDLAVENIYAEFRRRATRFFGVDNFQTSASELAKLIAERAKIDRAEIEGLLTTCENITRGEPTRKKEVLKITSRLREIEEKLNLRRTRKQAFRR